MRLDNGSCAKICQCMIAVEPLCFDLQHRQPRTYPFLAMLSTALAESYCSHSSSPTRVHERRLLQPSDQIVVEHRAQSCSHVPLPICPLHFDRKLGWGLAWQ